MRSINFVLGLFFLLGVWSAHADNIDITRQSLSSSDSQTDAESSSPTLTGDGSVVSFISSATTLVSGSSGSKKEIYIKNISSKAVESASPSGVTIDADILSQHISSDGTKIAFSTEASNIVSPDLNAKEDVFLYSISGKTFKLISQNKNASASDGVSTAPAVSATGRYVAFESSATNLVTGDSNEKKDIFLYDDESAETPITKVTFDTAAGPTDGDSTSPSVSSDGNYVVFASDATDLVSGDTNGLKDVFLYSKTGQSISKISQTVAGIAANAESSSPSISGDGRYIVFQSKATNLSDSINTGASNIYLLDRTGQTLQQISLSLSGGAPNGDSISPKISSDGTVIAFLSDATNLVASDSNNTPHDKAYDVFVYSKASNTITRKSTKYNGSDVSGTAQGISVNQDGKIVSFSSSASLLVPHDTNDSKDIFVTNENCVSDQDGDAVNTCLDSCPYDAAKTSAGQCGCGTAETDSDSDGAADCVDECDFDLLKTAEGYCGCGIKEEDLNFNGISDCKDPTSSTIPEKPRTARSKSGTSFILTTEYPGASFRIEITTLSGRKIKTISTKSSIVRYRIPPGRYKVRYQLLVGKLVKSKFSKSVTFTVLK